jgi:hypothetical protein
LFTSSKVITIQEVAYVLIHGCQMSLQARTRGAVRLEMQQVRLDPGLLPVPAVPDINTVLPRK